MKKRFLYFLSVCILLPMKVYADVIEPKEPIDPGIIDPENTTTNVQDFLIVFICIFVVLLILFIYKMIKNKKGK